VVWPYLFQRLLLIPPTLLGLSLLVFTLAILAPGDPAEEFARRTAPGGEVTAEDIERARRELGLDRPYAVQYGSWLWGAARADLGRSFSRRTPVWDEMRGRLAATAELAGAALAITTLVACPLGLAAGALHRRTPDHLLRLVALVGASIPGFFLSYLLIALFATRLGWLPVAGREGVVSLVLPAIALAVGPTAIVSRLLRSSVLEVLTEDFIRTARAKGLSGAQVLGRHALRNAAIPVVTVLGNLLGHLLAGAIIIEFVFAWPGLGQLTVESVFQRDYPMIQAIVFFAGAVFLTINLVVDLSYALLDPRVRLAGR
jgi:ABC-type dipeptide/oligopeptide/nickel transport system permease component